MSALEDIIENVKPYGVNAYKFYEINPYFFESHSHDLFGNYYRLLDIESLVLNTQPIVDIAPDQRPPLLA